MEKNEGSNPVKENSLVLTSIEMAAIWEACGPRVANGK